MVIASQIIVSQLRAAEKMLCSKVCTNNVGFEIEVWCLFGWLGFLPIEKWSSFQPEYLLKILDNNLKCPLVFLTIEVKD